MRLALLLGLLCVHSFAADGTDVIVFEAKQNLPHPSLRCYAPRRALCSPSPKAAISRPTKPATTW
jgi:hypothetical protein